MWQCDDRSGVQDGYTAKIARQDATFAHPAAGSNITERVVTLTQTAPPAEATHWTSARMAKIVDISASSVQRIWRAHGLQPHRVKQS